MKLRRSERLVDMTTYLMAHPSTLIPLSFFPNNISPLSHRLVKIWGSLRKPLN